jgi:signal transduction histidine kinase
MSSLNERVLIFSATQRDRESTCAILQKHDMAGESCTTFEDLIHKIEEGAGAVVLAKEVLCRESTAKLSALLNRQPTWSHLPVLLLISAGDLSERGPETLKMLKPLRNTTLLERPIRVSTLVSVIQSALADRVRQYEVRDLVNALQKSKKEADEANQAKSSFLANMSHEIRTPLGSIMGFSELLVEPGISEQEKKVFVQIIKRNGQQLSALIDDILDLAKVESGHIGIECTNIIVNDLLMEVLASLRHVAQKKGVQLILSVAPDLPEKIHTDPVRLRQILINIIGNGIKFTEKGSVRVDVTLRPPAKEGEASRLHFAVTDTGVGISEDQVDKLFRSFSQADNSITRRFGGTGLGLVLSKRLAKLLNGDLVLEQSTFGKGSTFALDIEFESAHEDARTIPDRISSSPRSLEGKLRNRRILVVDDSKDNQALIGRILSLSGAEVKMANDGIEGIEQAMAGNFDVILMDVQMPRLGGREATESLRKSGYSKPVIALTAHALREDREGCMAAGCDGYLTKPIQRNELIQTIMSHIA